MSAGALPPEEGESTAFVFSAENLDRAKRIIARYPEGRQQSAVLPLLDMAQRQNGNWLPRNAMDYVADLLAMPRKKSKGGTPSYSRVQVLKGSDVKVQKF